MEFLAIGAGNLNMSTGTAEVEEAKVATKEKRKFVWTPDPSWNNFLDEVKRHNQFLTKKREQFVPATLRNAVTQDSEGYCYFDFDTLSGQFCCNRWIIGLLLWFAVEPDPDTPGQYRVVYRKRKSKKIVASFKLRRRAA